jgi:hypothetical protein
MIKSIYLSITFLFINNIGFSQDSTLSKLSFDMKLRYDSARAEFNNYEKKHGGFNITGQIMQ